MKVCSLIPALTCLGILLKAAFFPGVGCQITETNNTLLAATFIYSMAFDFLVLSLTAWKLVIGAPRYGSYSSTLVFYWQGV